MAWTCRHRAGQAREPGRSREICYTIASKLLRSVAETAPHRSRGHGMHAPPRRAGSSRLRYRGHRRLRRVRIAAPGAGGFGEIAGNEAPQSAEPCGARERAAVSRDGARARPHAPCRAPAASGSRGMPRARDQQRDGQRRPEAGVAERRVHRARDRDDDRGVDDLHDRDRDRVRRERERGDRGERHARAHQRQARQRVAERERQHDRQHDRREVGEAQRGPDDHAREPRRSRSP